MCCPSSKTWEMYVWELFRGVRMNAVLSLSLSVHVWEEQRTWVCVLAAFLYGSCKSTNSFITLAALKTKLCPLCFYWWSLVCWHVLRVLIAQDFENKMWDQLPVSECQLARKRRRRAPSCPSFCLCFMHKYNVRCCINSQRDGCDKLFHFAQDKCCMLSYKMHHPSWTLFFFLKGACLTTTIPAVVLKGKVGWLNSQWMNVT